MVFLTGDPEVFTHLLELEVRNFVPSMLSFAEEVIFSF